MKCQQKAHRLKNRETRISIELHIHHSIGMAPGIITLIPDLFAPVFTYRGKNDGADIQIHSPALTPQDCERGCTLILNIENVSIFGSLTCILKIFNSEKMFVASVTFQQLQKKREWLENANSVTTKTVDYRKEQHPMILKQRGETTV